MIEGKKGNKKDMRREMKERSIFIEEMRKDMTVGRENMRNMKKYQQILSQRMVNTMMRKITEENRREWMISTIETTNTKITRDMNIKITRDTTIVGMSLMRGKMRNL